MYAAPESAVKQDNSTSVDAHKNNAKNKLAANEQGSVFAKAPKSKLKSSNVLFDGKRLVDNINTTQTSSSINDVSLSLSCI